MRIQLLGTGSPAGWPDPWCGCASCAWAAAHEVRFPTAVLIDDVLLLGDRAAAGRAAARLGVSLCLVRFSVADPGPYRVRVLGPSGWVDVTGPDGGRLLFAAAGDPAGVAVPPGAAYDVVLAAAPGGSGLAAAVAPGGSGGVATGAPGGSPGLAAAVADLRRRGAVDDGTQVVGVHLGHRNPPGDELGRRLALLGATALPDGAVLDTGAPAAAHRPAGRVLVTGGSRSGKSAEAERRLAAEPEVVYVATAGPPPPGDPEWAARIDAHRSRRPRHWVTLETVDLVPLLRGTGPPLLVDSLGLWLVGGPDSAAGARTDDLVAAWRDTTRQVVAVTEEVGSGVVPATASGRAFRDGLGRLNARIAADSDEVWLTVAGVPIRLS